MTSETATTEFRWGLIVALGALGLVRPVAGVLGVVDGPSAGIVLTLLVPAIWIGAVVLWRVPNPFVTLVLVGGAYALFVLAGIVAVTGGVSALAPTEVTGIFAFNLVWGATAGAIAVGIRRAQA